MRFQIINVAARLAVVRTPGSIRTRLLLSTKDATIRTAPSLVTYVTTRGMKRTATGTKKPTKPKEKLRDYCDVELKRGEDGEPVWPAPAPAITTAREFLRECASSGKKTLIVPDKDSDGLSSGIQVYRTLTTLGLDPSLLDVHLVQKGTTVHHESEREAMSSKKPSYIVVLDQGSVGGPPVVPDPDVKSLLLDHHLSDHFPEHALVVSACHYPPVATTSLLTYHICSTLHPTLPDSLAYLACIGTLGDLGNTLKWLPPFPDMSATFKQHTKKAINDAVSLVNAPRRTSKFDVISAWTALLASTSPADLLTNPRLLSARAEINHEVELHTHTPPKFTHDAKIAVLKINSSAQVHPVIATRWAGYLNSKSLEIVMVANYGYLPGMVNFSCRIARSARNRDPPVNIIASLKEAAALSEDRLAERLGESFARGHKEASGGIVPTEAFEEFMTLLRVGEKAEKKEGEEEGKAAKKVVKGVEKSPQKNTLGNYFKKA